MTVYACIVPRDHISVGIVALMRVHTHTHTFIVRTAEPIMPKMIHLELLRRTPFSILFTIFHISDEA